MKIHKIDFGNGRGKIKAFIDIETQEGFIISGFKILDGQNGLWIGWPTQKIVREGGEEYYPIVKTNQPYEVCEFRQKVNKLILDYYKTQR